MIFLLPLYSAGNLVVNFFFSLILSNNTDSESVLFDFFADGMVLYVWLNVKTYPNYLF